MTKFNILKSLSLRTSGRAGVTNVYGDGTSTATAGANTITHYYDKAGIKAANELNIYAQWADRKSMPTNMGKTYKVSKFIHIYDRETTDSDFAAHGYLTSRNITDVSAGLTAAGLVEGAGAVNKVSIKKVTIETSFSRYGQMLDYTDEVDLFSEDSMQVHYREELGRLANRKMEDLIQLDMLGTTNILYAGTATSTITLGTGLTANGASDSLYRVDYDYVRKASRKLVRNRADKNTSVVTGSTKIDTRTINKAFYAIIGPEVKYDLEALTRGSSYETEYAYIPAYKYAGASNLAEGEVGAMHDVRFIESESAVVYRGAGAPVPGIYTGSALEYAGTLSYKTFTGADTTATATAIAAVRTKVATVATATGVITDHANAATAIAAVGAGVELVEQYFDVFPLLFPTSGSFATVGLKGKGKIVFNSQSPEKIELGNPYGTNGFFSYNFWYAGLILQEEKLLKGLVLASN